ncbi:hypothetical protein B0H10DRAFT_1223414 [Mycena sp. CBHHK59/15]|nr:hypothetical protein B0H10DRAFT_1223414 [Mycena sp. CBHHK59/15]
MHHGHYRAAMSQESSGASQQRTRLHKSPSSGPPPANPRATGVALDPAHYPLATEFLACETRVEIGRGADHPSSSVDVPTAQLLDADAQFVRGAGRACLPNRATSWERRDADKGELLRVRRQCDATSQRAKSEFVDRRGQDKPSAAQGHFTPETPAVLRAGCHRKPKRRRSSCRHHEGRR